MTVDFSTLTAFQLLQSLEGLFVIRKADVCVSLHPSSQATLSFCWQHSVYLHFVADSPLPISLHLTLGWLHPSSTPSVKPPFWRFCSLASIQVSLTVSGGFVSNTYTDKHVCVSIDTNESGEKTHLDFNAAIKSREMHIVSILCGLDFNKVNTTSS